MIINDYALNKKLSSRAARALTILQWSCARSLVLGTVYTEGVFNDAADGLPFVYIAFFLTSRFFDFSRRDFCGLHAIFHALGDAIFRAAIERERNVETKVARCISRSIENFLIKQTFENSGTAVRSKRILIR